MAEADLGRLEVQRALVVLTAALIGPSSTATPRAVVISTGVTSAGDREVLNAAIASEFIGTSREEMPGIRNPARPLHGYWWATRCVQPPPGVVAP